MCKQGFLRHHSVNFSFLLSVLPFWIKTVSQSSGLPGEERRASLLRQRMSDISCTRISHFSALWSLTSSLPRSLPHSLPALPPPSLPSPFLPPSLLPSFPAILPPCKSISPRSSDIRGVGRDVWWAHSFPSPPSAPPPTPTSAQPPSPPPSSSKPHHPLFILHTLWVREDRCLMICFGVSCPHPMVLWGGIMSECVCVCVSLCMCVRAP